MLEQTVLVMASIWAANLVAVSLVKRPKVRNSRKGAELIAGLNSLFTAVVALINFLKK